MNPLFPSNNSDENQSGKPDPGYVLPRQHGKIQPLHTREELRSHQELTELTTPAHSQAQSQQTQHVQTQPAPHAPFTQSQPTTASDNPAANLIRHKIDHLYAHEPSTRAELAETEAIKPRSKHQQFMHDLSVSGRPLAEIQVAWHKYYTELPDTEKHEVWQEFYAANERQPSAYTQYVQKQQALAQTHTAQMSEHGASAEQHAGEHASQLILPGSHAHSGAAKPASAVLTPTEALLARYEGRLNTGDESDTGPAIFRSARSRKKASTKSGVPSSTSQTSAEPQGLPSLPHKVTRDKRSIEAIRRQIKTRVRAANDRVPQQAKRQLKSLFFGLSMGALVLLVFLFGFFNEVIIAPFIQPSRHASATPIILTSQDLAPGSTPEVIIPKINVEIPVDYTQTSSNESDIEGSLQNGVVHYPTTTVPGQKGNAAFFGHSSNNIFNPGKYKFAFVLLHTLVPGDIFYLTYNQKVYTYRVYDKKIVSPKDVSVLDNVDGRVATATLITCDPPGTSLNRLVVWGEQVSPDPTANGDSSTSNATTQPTVLASNGPTLWGRLTHWVTHW